MDSAHPRDVALYCPCYPLTPRHHTRPHDSSLEPFERALLVFGHDLALLLLLVLGGARGGRGPRVTALSTFPKQVQGSD